MIYAHTNTYLPLKMVYTPKTRLVILNSRCRGNWNSRRMYYWVTVSCLWRLVVALNCCIQVWHNCTHCILALVEHRWFWHKLFTKTNVILCVHTPDWEPLLIGLGESDKCMYFVQWLGINGIVTISPNVRLRFQPIRYTFDALHCTFMYT